MFEALISKVTTFVTTAVRAGGELARHQPWLTTAAVLAVLLLW